MILQATSLVPQDGGAGGGGSGDGFTTVEKAADEAKAADTTLAIDDELKFTAAANTVYIVEGVIFYNCISAADIKTGLMGPASPTMVVTANENYGPQQTSVQDDTDAAFQTAGTARTGLDGDGTHKFFARIETTTGGTVGFGWAQAASNASATTVYKGSRIRYKAIA